MGVHVLVHALVVLALPPLLPGVIAKTKARFAGRRGPPVLQLYWDLAKLLRKGAVYSATTTWVFRAGPLVSLAALLAAALVLPLFDHRAPLAFEGDVFLFAYLLALARFFTAAAALDTGSAFEGMGAAREVSFAALAEPAVFFALAVVARATRSASLSAMFGGALAPLWETSGVALLLVAVALFAVLLAENSRIPFDDPTTHLELTMIHEAMVLDHGGVDLAFVLYGAALKLMLFGALVTRVALPVEMLDPWLAWGLFVAAQVALAALVGVVESTMARLRLARVPPLLVGACVLAGLGLVLLLR